MMPVNMSAQQAAQTFTCTHSDDLGVPEAPKIEELGNWSQEMQQLDLRMATTLGFAVGGLSGNLDRQLLLFESSRWRDVEGAAMTFRYGVAIRALVVVSDVKGEGSLTLPVVAAKVELGQAQAMSQLSVRGYRGADLGDLLPDWQSFGVDNYVQFIKSVSAIQKRIMKNTAQIVPELLATKVAALPPCGSAVGTVYALDAIATGDSLAEALEGLVGEGMNGEVVAAVEKTYTQRLGPTSKVEKPDEAQCKAARNDLGALRLRHGFFN